MASVLVGEKLGTRTVPPRRMQRPACASPLLVRSSVFGSALSRRLAARPGLLSNRPAGAGQVSARLGRIGLGADNSRRSKLGAGPMSTEELAAALQRAATVYRRRPDMGLQDDTAATSRWEGGTRVATSHPNGTQMSSDMPAEFGGTGDR